MIGLIVGSVVFAGLPLLGLLTLMGGGGVEYLDFVFSSALSADRGRPRARQRPGRDGVPVGRGERGRRRYRAAQPVLAGSRVPRRVPRALGRADAGADVDLAAADGDAEMSGVVALSARMLRFRVAAMMWMFF